MYRIGKTPKQIIDEVNYKEFKFLREQLLKEIKKPTIGKTRKAEAKDYLKQINEQMKILEGRLF